MKARILVLSAAALVAGAGSAAFVISKREVKIAAAKKALGNELPQAIFNGETGDRLDFNKQLQQAKRTWVVPVFYQCAGACNAVIERVLGKVAGSEALKSSLGRDFQVLFFSIDAKEAYQLADVKRKGALDRKSIVEPRERNAIRFLSGGGSSGEMLARALRFRFAWNAEAKTYDHDLKIFEVDDKGVVTGEFALDELNSITVAQTK